VVGIVVERLIARVRRLVGHARVPRSVDRLEHGRNKRILVGGVTHKPVSAEVIAVVNDVVVVIEPLLFRHGEEDGAAR
jgi:hypothetical protein